MLHRKKYTILLILLLIAGVAALFIPVEVNYKIKTRALVQPVQSWELSRLPDGSLISAFRNQLTGAIESYSVTEFRRGDVVRFELRKELFQGFHISKGDTIGFLYSNDEEVRLAELLSEVEVLKAELIFYATGEKPEDVARAEREVAIARRDLETKRLRMERANLLLADSVISMQQYELDQHELDMKELAVQLAEARLAVVTTGDKPERIRLIRTRIEAAEEQIRQIQGRIEQLTLVSPMDGMLVLDRNFLDKDMLVKIADTTAYVGIAPVLLRDKPYIASGNTVVIRDHMLARNRTLGSVHDFNNVSEILQGQTVVFFSVFFDASNGSLMPGKMVDIEVAGVPLTPREYVYKLFRSPM